MYRNIMVPTDGSGFDREAIRAALRLAERSKAKIKLVRILSSGSLFGIAAASDGTAGAAEVVRSERDNALSELYALAAECRNLSDADIGVDLHSGPVADTLAGYARRQDADLIVMSTHCRSGLARLALGSVTDSLIRRTSIPVLIVKPPASYLNPRIGETFRSMVVPLDGSRVAEQILPRVMSLARLENAIITLLHVLTRERFTPTDTTEPDGAWWEKDVSMAEDYLERVAKKLRRYGTPVKTDIVVSQNVPQAISDFASREKEDLIAIATHGRGGLARMLRGSVADAVLHSANASMLVLKPESVPENNGGITREEALSVYWPGVDLVPT